MAYLAVRDDMPEEGCGVARYVRSKDNPRSAEAAVVIADSYQGQGLGTLLLGLLSKYASWNDIDTFSAFVLADNGPMMRLLYEAGATIFRDSNGLYKVEVPVPRDPDCINNSAAKNLLKYVTKQMVPPIGTRFHRAFFAKMRQIVDRKRNRPAEESRGGRTQARGSMR